LNSTIMPFAATLSDYTKQRVRCLRQWLYQATFRPLR